MLGKLDATASINTSGVGLGLSTCKKIAEALNGEIFIVEDEEVVADHVQFSSDNNDSKEENHSHDKYESNRSRNINKKEK